MNSPEDLEAAMLTAQAAYRDYSRKLVHVGDSVEDTELVWTEETAARVVELRDRAQAAEDAWKAAVST